MAQNAVELTIGALARRTGVSVKTLRYYSDEGLLPPLGRTASRYRVYSPESVQRIELIRTLRDAGLGIERIREVLSKKRPLADALRLQLCVIEAQLRALKHVASALRAALRSEPTEHDVRRLSAVTRLSNEERRSIIERFYEQVSAGSKMDPAWKSAMVDASAVDLPDEPTPAQLDAWIELSEMVQDPTFVESMKRSANEVWSEAFDHQAFARAWKSMASASQTIDPESDAARAIVERFVTEAASAMGRAPDAEFRREMLGRFERQDLRGQRYWEVVAVLRGAPVDTAARLAAEWISKASRIHSA